MAGTKGKTLAFACEQCKSGKRKCDGVKPKCLLCSRLGKPCTYVEQRPKKRKYWDEDYVKGLEQQVQALLAVVRQVSYGTPTPTPWTIYSPHPLRSLLWHSKSGFSYRRSSSSTPSSARNHTDCT
ncbi:putative transcriptional regulatory protein [Colletotrichum viniferum]|nr:putative transcriptional regulatory protein [Colletotrichum viniferum]